MPVRRIIDAGYAAALRLPTPGGVVRRAVSIPMRDGAVLVGDHYAPAARSRGTVLLRTPYRRGFPFSLAFARVYAAQGYHVLVANVRGTFGSGGTFTPMVDEAADGADTVAWLRAQPWFTGRFATIGLSYLGFTQWALALDPPPELAAAVVIAGPHDFADSTWSTGAFTLNDFLSWSHLLARQQHRPGPRAAWRSLTARAAVRRALSGLPLAGAGRALLRADAPWYESWLAHPDPADEFWGPYRGDGALAALTAPVLLIGGWQDLFLTQTLTQYRRLTERGVPVHLTVGPWTHSRLPRSGLRLLTRETLSWLDRHLAGDPVAAEGNPVRVFVAGRGWRELPAWPPPTRAEHWQLRPGGVLAAGPGEDAAGAAAGAAGFRFDPADPTPTVGGRLLSPDSGYRDDSALAERPDTLCFTSAPLDAERVVYGRPVLEIDHQADGPDFDVFVRVGVVDARGRSRNVSDGYRRLHAHRGPVRVELDPIAHRFAVGDRIRVLIAGGCFPRYDRNPGTGEPPLTAVRHRPVRHTVRFGASRLTLPVG